jgi:hypothetical protein
MIIFAISLICSCIINFEFCDLSSPKNMPDTRNMSEIMRHSERLTNGDDGVVRSIPDVPITEERKPFMNSESAKLHHTGMCSRMKQVAAKWLT